jgi:kynurenine formamidase
MSQRWTRRPEGSNWGDFGPNDQIGRLNLLTPERILAAVREAREGRSFCLSLPLEYPGGNALSASRFPPVLRPTLRNGRIRMNYKASDDDPRATDLICDDAVVLHSQYSTHWDALSHVGFMFDADGDGIPEPRYYNGFRGGIDIVGPEDPADAGASGVFEAKSTCAAKALGISNMAQVCVQGRGVMIDIHARVGRERAVVGYDALMRILEEDGVEIETGDMVCLHTGFAQMILDMQGSPDPYLLHNACAVLDGRDQRLLRWITDTGLAVLIADNFAVESFPALEQPECCAAAPLHEHCLFKLGIHLGELWHLTPLAQWLRKNRRYCFLLTAPPLRLTGAVGSPTTPVATV